MILSPCIKLNSLQASDISFSRLRAPLKAFNSFNLDFGNKDIPLQTANDSSQPTCNGTQNRKSRFSLFKVENEQTSENSDKENFMDS